MTITRNGASSETAITTVTTVVASENRELKEYAMAVAKTAAKKTAAKKAPTAGQALMKTAQTPFVTAYCDTQTCSQYEVEQTVPAGIVVAPQVLMNGTLSCMECGAHLTVTGKADDSES